jgi:acyl-CoA reductase-like NAD-dependent aldehyde dehydrogenase
MDGVIGVISPHTGEPVAQVPAAAEGDVDEAARAADASDWPCMPLRDRLEIAGRFAVGHQNRALAVRRNRG